MKHQNIDITINNTIQQTFSPRMNAHSQACTFVDNFASLLWLSGSIALSSSQSIRLSNDCLSTRREPWISLYHRQLARSRQKQFSIQSPTTSLHQSKTNASINLFGNTKVPSALARSARHSLKFSEPTKPCWPFSSAMRFTKYAHQTVERSHLILSMR